MYNLQLWPLVPQWYCSQWILHSQNQQVCWHRHRFSVYLSISPPMGVSQPAAMLSDTVSTSLRCRSGLQVIGRDDIAPLPPAQPIFLLAKPPCLLLTFDLPAMPSEGAAANACYWEIFLVRTPAVKESISPSCSAPIYQGKVLASLAVAIQEIKRSVWTQAAPSPA